MTEKEIIKLYIKMLKLQVYNAFIMAPIAPDEEKKKAQKAIDELLNN